MTNEHKTKTANIAKVHFLMKEKGMSAVEAIKSAYPSWPEEKVKALAVKLESMKGAGKAMASGGPMAAKKEEPQEEGAEKEASVLMSGLKHGSLALYGSYMEKKAPREKLAEAVSKNWLSNKYLGPALSLSDNDLYVNYMARSPYVNTGLNTQAYKEKQAMLNPLGAAKALGFLKTVGKEGGKLVSKGATGAGKFFTKNMPKTTAVTKAKFKEMIKNNPKAWAAIKKYYKPALGGVAGGVALGKLVD